MRFVGVDIAAERHVFAILGEDGAVLARPTPFGEDAEGYAKLLQALARGPALVVMEATGHYWKNLFAVLVAADHPVALLNPLRSRRFQDQDLPRTRTDAIDALGLARFAREKRPAPTQLGEAATEELKELVRHRDRLKQDFDDRVRQLHRLVDLGFPEFTRYVRALDSQLATVSWPTTRALRRSQPPRRTVWPSCAATAGTRSVANSRASWSRPPGARSVSITGRRTGSRSATSARTWTSGASA
jgi:transposase